MDLDTLVSLAKSALSPVERPELLLHAAALEAGPNDYYYRFLYLLSAHMKARAGLEIGTYRGTSSIHIAGPEARVVTIDINQDAAERVRKLGLDRVTPITASSDLAMRDPTELAKVLALAPYDICFIDGDHTFNSAYGDYARCWPHVREGGVIVFDDIKQTMDGDEMRVFWDHVVDPKVELDWLHANAGFGAAIRGSTAPPSWTAVIDAASREIVRRRA